MIPHKTKRGQAALARLRVFDGIPSPYDKRRRVVVPTTMAMHLDLRSFSLLILTQLKNEFS